jgi:MFS family permease
MTQDLHATKFQASMGLSVYTLGFAFLPLFTSSFSEEFGRKPIYIVSAIGYFAMFAMVALYVHVSTLPSQPLISFVMTYFFKIKEYSDGDCGAISAGRLWFGLCHIGWRNSDRHMVTNPVRFIYSFNSKFTVIL